MIRLPPLLPPSSVSKQDWRHTGRLSKRGNLLTREGGARSHIIRSQKSIVFYESFNTLWWNISDAKINHLYLATYLGYTNEELGSGEGRKTSDFPSVGIPIMQPDSRPMSFCRDSPFKGIVLRDG